jgi:D-arabinose 1-dehydrogenase-like Zn-dependent alcohol dehydrogenase
VSPVKAAVLAAYERPLEIRDYPGIDDVGPGEALVRIEMAGVCGTDVHLWLGQLSIPLPVVLGHETVGRIEALGPGLDKDWHSAPLKAGDRVTWASSIVCGECFYCRIKRQPTRCLSRKAYGISYCADQPPHLRGGYAEKMAPRSFAYPMTSRPAR